MPIPQPPAQDPTATDFLDTTGVFHDVQHAEVNASVREIRARVVHEPPPTMWVRPDGDNTEPGGEFTPKQTLQAAVDAVGDNTTIRAAEIRFRGDHDLSSTLLISRKSLSLVGIGSAGAPGAGSSLIRWTGAAGVPVIELDRAWGARFERFRIVKGSGAGIPSAAMRLRAFAGQANPNAKITADQLWLGPAGNYDAVSTETHFDHGVLIDGDNLNNDMSVWDNLRIARATTGVKLEDTQNVGHHFEGLMVLNHVTGFDTGASIASGSSWYFLSGTGFDIHVHDQAQLHLSDFSSEFGSRFAKIGAPGSGALFVHGGRWQRHATFMAADGVIIDSEHNNFGMVYLEDFEMPFSGSPPTPVIRMKATAASAAVKYFIVERANIDPAWLDMPLITPGNSGDRRHIRIRRAGSGLPNYAYMENILQGGSGPVITTVNADRWDIPKAVMMGKSVTGSRPSASAVGQGAQWFDTTLGKPIWSDGTNWRDAAGTVV